MNKVLTAIALALFAVCLTFFLVLYGWELFMVPVFGLRSLSLTEALGFIMLASIFKDGKTK